MTKLLGSPRGAQGWQWLKSTRFTRRQTTRVGWDLLHEPSVGLTAPFLNVASTGHEPFYSSTVIHKGPFGLPSLWSTHREHV